MPRKRRGGVNGRVQLPITVRQAQIYLSKLSKTANGMPLVLQTALDVKSFLDFEEGLKRLAQLASKDPNQVLLDEKGNCVLEPENSKNADPKYAPKGTDEVAPQSDSPSQDSPLHGGSNASQEVENGQSGGGNNDSLNSTAQLQAPTADGGSQGHTGNGDAQDCQDNAPDSSGRNAPQSSCSETGGFSTSEDCESGGKPQAPFSHKADSSGLGGSESGEGTATSPVRDNEKDLVLANNDSASRDEQVHQDSLTHPPVNNVNSDRQTGKEESTEGRSRQDADKNHQELGDDIPDGLLNGASDQASDDIPTHQKKWGKSFNKAERGEGKLSLSANNNTGKITASLKEAEIDSKLLKLCRERLSALVGDSSQDFSPRRDYHDFCVRLKTFRNPQPARKEEEGRPVILLLADVSPSCSSFSKESVKVAKAATKLGVSGADILVVSHFNGDPKEMEINGKSVPVRDVKPSRNIKAVTNSEDCYGNYCDWYDALLKQYQITVCIALGDWDASSEYAYLIQHPQVERVIWLDNAHCSSRGTVKERTEFALKQYQQYQNYSGIKIPLLRQKLIYKDGCKDAIAFVNGIKI